MPCFTTIQAGVNNATKPPGDVPALVRVFPGTYNESVNFSTMGSAVAGTPDDILVGRDDLVQQFTTASAPAPAMEPPVSSLPPELVQRMVDARQRAAELLSAVALSTLPTNAAGAAVTVMSPGGPAFWNSVSPFPGSIAILGIDVVLG